MAFVPYWAKSACLKGANADTLFRAVSAAEREPDVNTFPMTGSSTRFNLLFRLNWEDPEVPMLYPGITEDGRGMDLPQSGQRVFCPRQPATAGRLPPSSKGAGGGLFLFGRGSPRSLIALIPRHRQTVAALIFRVAGVPLHPHKFHLMIL